MPGVANELSASFSPNCPRAASSVVAGFERQLLLPNGTLGLVLSRSSVELMGGFAHDSNGAAGHREKGCMPKTWPKCTNGSRPSGTGSWTAEAYADARHASLSRSCGGQTCDAQCGCTLDPWTPHAKFAGLHGGTRSTLWPQSNCLHANVDEAERYQRAFLSLLKRRPLPRCCAPPLWNELRVRWKLSDVVGVYYTVESSAWTGSPEPAPLSSSEPLMTRRPWTLRLCVAKGRTIEPRPDRTRGSVHLAGHSPATQRLRRAPNA